jgi:hypothetical protein
MIQKIRIFIYELDVGMVEPHKCVCLITLSLHFLFYFIIYLSYKLIIINILVKCLLLQVVYIFLIHLYELNQSIKIFNLVYSIKLLKNKNRKKIK